MKAVLIRKLLVSFTYLVAVLFSTNAAAQFMDVIEVTSGTTGSFTATIGLIDVSGRLAGDDPDTQISEINYVQSFAASINDGSSVQYSDKAFYSPSSAMGDKVGYLLFSSQGTEVLTITFSEPVTNPVFHVANLDSMIWDFAPSGLTAGDLRLLSGNAGSDGDGLEVDDVNPVVRDAMPETIVGIEDADPVPRFPEARSAYGSVMIFGTFTELKINMLQNPEVIGGDGGTFQISLPPQVCERAPGPSRTVNLLVNIDSGDEAGLIEAITSANDLFGDSGQRTEIRVMDSGQPFDFASSFSDAENALPDYTGAWYFSRQNASQRLVFNAIGAEQGTFRLITIREGGWNLDHARVTGFGVKVGNGGAILMKSDGALNVTKSDFVMNVAAAGRGGAIHREGQGRLFARYNWFYSNHAGTSGGAISLAGGTSAYNHLDIIRNRFQGNSAIDDGTGLFIDVDLETSAVIRIEDNAFSFQEDSINIASADIPLRIKNNTFAGQAPAVETHVGGQLFGNIFGAAEVEVANSRQAHSGDAGKPEVQCNEEGNMFASLGYNISQDDSCTAGQGSDLTNTDPLIEEPDSDGIIGLMQASPAIDHGAVDVFTWEPDEPAVLPCGAIDIAGNARPQDANDDGVFECDSGSLDLMGVGAVSSSHSGAYFNPLRSGEGNYVEILDDGAAVVYTFSYRPDGSGLAWFIGVGEWRDNSIIMEEIFRPVGTSFGDGFNKDDIELVPTGEMSMVFPDCKSGNEKPGNVAYSGMSSSCGPGFGYEGVITKAERISTIVDCDGQTPQENAGLSGSWFDPDRNGEGVIVEWLTNGDVLVIFFTYDQNDDQLWLFGVGTPDGLTVTIDAVYPSAFTRWGRLFDQDEVMLDTWGTLTFTWTDCNNMIFDYDSTVEGFGQARRNYTRLTQLADTECSLPAAASANR